MSDPATNTMNVTYEEMTGVHIDWIQSQDYTTDLNLMIAGEQDVDLWLIPFSTSQVLTMVDAGKLLPLNDLIDEYAPNLKAALEEHPEFREYLTAPGRQHLHLLHHRLRPAHAQPPQDVCEKGLAERLPRERGR